MNSIAHYCRAAALVTFLFAGQTLLPGATFEKNLQHTFNVGLGGKLVLDAGLGTCEVKPADTDKVEVRVLRKVKGGDQAKADKLFANNEVSFKQEGSTVSIISKIKKPFTESWMWNRVQFELRYEITVPRKFDADLKTAGGDLLVGSLEGAVRTHTSSGSIRLKQIGGEVFAENAGGDIDVEGSGAKLAAHTSSGSIKIGKVAGPADLENSGGDINVMEAGQSLSAKTSSGSINVENAGGAAKLANSGGDIKIASCGGELRAETTSGDIRVGQVKGAKLELKNAGGNISIESADGDLVAETTSGSIKIQRVQGIAALHNSGGDIHIAEAGGNVKASTTSGQIKVGRAQGKVELQNAGGDLSLGECKSSVVAETTSGSIHFHQVEGTAVLKNAGGDIKLDSVTDWVRASTTSGTVKVGWTRVPTENCRLEAMGGDIYIALPKSAEVDLDAEAQGGEVKSGFPVTVNGAPRSDVLRGKLNGGGKTMLLRSSSGSIHVGVSKD